VSGKPVQNDPDVALALKGDERAFERLYRIHHGRVFTLALRMAGPLWAEDLTQDVFIRAWNKLGTFRQEASFGTWLYRLAVNLILSRRQTLKKRQQSTVPGGDEALKTLATRQSSPGLALDFEEAIQKLPEGARDVFVLYEIQGYPHAEIGDLMGISVGTSKSQLHRARMMLREHLN
jgi:RNA polymerase sigma-70 factor (ECF subfamily)